MKYSYKPSHLNESRGHNHMVLMNFRTLFAIICGIVSGILGLNGVSGFLMFLAYGCLGSFFFLIKIGKGYLSYYPSFGTIFRTWLSGFMEYLLSWIVFYNIIYVLS
ncbi:unnamed protein product [Blepharisma stoltei]|uniref:ER membrane protein complex subunit 6 n=1 Tax=Blepharisma stoltei TaxID=1481888 RepID=A0AAU9KAQ7_9CILI|nr:unnamed protein product [Blepharisma stoltei]